MEYTTIAGQRIICASYHDFMKIAKQYFPQLPLTAWRAK